MTVLYYAIHFSSPLVLKNLTWNVQECILKIIYSSEYTLHNTTQHYTLTNPPPTCPHPLIHIHDTYDIPESV